MSLMQLVYASKPFGFEPWILEAILADARRCNVRDGITGALICRADVYLQLLEGPGPTVDAAFARIARDDRHLEVHRLIHQPVSARMFPRWAMRDDPARSWMWTARQVAAGAITQASPTEVVGVFQRLIAEPETSPSL